ncbi:MAG TPA: DUF3006 family protein [Nitrososphaera sp.]|nr:DUF3006 family protein [Nitrososphaera sp.]
MEKVIRASFDRVEGDYAVVYTDEGQQKIDIPIELLDKIRPGTRLLLHVKDDDVVHAVEVDVKATEDAKNSIHSKYARLRRRSRTTSVSSKDDVKSK